MQVAYLSTSTSEVELEQYNKYSSSVPAKQVVWCLIDSDERGLYLSTNKDGTWSVGIDYGFGDGPTEPILTTSDQVEAIKKFTEIWIEFVTAEEVTD